MCHVHHHELKYYAVWIILFKVKVTMVWSERRGESGERQAKDNGEGGRERLRGRGVERVLVIY